MNSRKIFETDRLKLRRPRATDAADIFRRYPADEEVTRYVCWTRHRSITDTQELLNFSDSAWKQWPIGPYLIEAKDEGALIGSVGIAFETPYRASVGYVLAKDAWGKGYASEALRGLLEITKQTDLRRIYALCHCDHPASIRVLEKCGFSLEGRLARHTIFPNLGLTEPSDVLCYAYIRR